MTNPAAKDVDDYIAHSAPDAIPHLRAIRAAIKAAVPKAEEGIHWGKPFYSHHGMLAGFDAMKKHISFEVWTDRLDDDDRATLEDRGHKTGKRTFQIAFDQDVPVAIIKKLVKTQASLNEAKKEKKG